MNTKTAAQQDQRPTAVETLAAPSTQGHPVAVKPALRSDGNGVAAIIPRDIEAVYRAAQGIARAGWAPKSYGTDVDKIAIGIMHGMEVGFTPIAALQSIAVINGTPCIWGDGAMALVQASGLAEDIDETSTMDDKGVVVGFTCTIKRRDRKTPIVRTFSLADAAKAGLLGKDSPWKTYPQRMLQMRSRSWALRDGFADVLRGLSIREEVEDYIDLKSQGDGSYAPVAEPAPPRPQRADYAKNPPVQEPAPEAEPLEWPLIDQVGERLALYDSPWAFADGFVEFLGVLIDKIKADPATVRTYIDNNQEGIDVLAGPRGDKGASDLVQRNIKAESEGPKK